MADGEVTLPTLVPQLTLGWEVMKWAGKYLKHANGPRAGKPFRFSDSQALFLLHYYSLTLEGRWVYDRAARRWPKGAGKSPFAAVQSLAEFLGPCRLKDWDPKAPGGCVGRRQPLAHVQIAATTLDQTANTMKQVRAMAPKGSRVAQEYGLDIGMLRYNAPDGSLLEVITSSAAAAEGAEVTHCTADEALVLGTVIPTPSGWTTIGDIEVGDRVFGSHGPATVTHVTPIFEGRPCFRVTFEDGTSLVADEGHLWDTKVVSNLGIKPKVRTTRQMLEDGRRFSVPKMAPFDGPDVEMPMDPYVLGAWLGNGSTRWASLTVADKDLEHLLTAVRGRGVPAAKATRYGERAVTVSLQGNAQGMRYTKDGSSVRGALVKLGVLGDKHIPAYLLRASLSQRLDLLRGLMDTDGHIQANGGAVFVNSNRRLIDDVLELVRSLGYTAAVSERVDERWPSNPTIYKVHFRPDSDRNCFLLPRKADKVRGRSIRQRKTITSIVPVESQPVKCIEVDSDDHLFVAGDGWTLTHNTEHWTPNRGGHALMEVIERNLSKSGSRLVETANAWQPGDYSVAEATWDMFCAQREGRTRGEARVLYDARVPAGVVLSDEDDLMEGLRFAYGDAAIDAGGWVDLRTQLNFILNGKTKADTARRFYLNQPTVSVDAWTTPHQWAALTDPTRVVADDEDVALFFDGSLSRDATALIGCCISDGHVFTLGVWEPDPGDADDQVSALGVDLTVAQAFERYSVVGFFADVREWESFTKVSWPERYAADLTVHAVPSGKEPQPIAWDMRGQTDAFTKAAELCLDEIEQKQFTHDGDERVARHVANARMRPTRSGVSISKDSKDSPKKIDAAVCVIGARMVRRQVLASKEYIDRSRRTSKMTVW